MGCELATHSYRGAICLQSPAEYMKGKSPVFEGSDQTKTSLPLKNCRKNTPSLSGLALSDPYKKKLCTRLTGTLPVKTSQSSGGKCKLTSA